MSRAAAFRLFVPVLVLVALGFAFASAAFAADVFCQHTIGKKNTSASTKYTDFHVEMESDTNLTLDPVWRKVRDPGGFHTPSSIQNDGTHKVTVDWTGLNVQPGQSIGGSIRFKQAAKNYCKSKGDWTHGGGLALGQTFVPVPSLGLRVEDNGDYFLTNSYDEAIDYSGFQYVVQSVDLGQTEEQAADMMRAVADGSPFPFTWTPLPSGTVPADTEQFLINLEISPGEFLFAYMDATFASAPSDVSHILQGHEHQTPQVPAASHRGLVLLVFLLGLAVAVFVRLRAPVVPIASVVVGCIVFSPVRLATPPEANAAELARWNDPAKVGRNNCYNYATNFRNCDPTKKVAQPGYTDPNTMGRSWTGTSDDAEYCAQVIARAVTDGLSVVQGSPNPGDPEPTESNLLALVVSRANKDYHWYRRDGMGNWSHKPGKGKARTYYGAGSEAAGPKVTDPRDPNQFSPYSSFCGYLEVPKPAPALEGYAYVPPPSDGIRCVRLLAFGEADPFTEFTGAAAADLIARMPTQLAPVPDPDWDEPSLGGPAIFDLEPGADYVGSFPAALVRVSQGVVGFYSEPDGVPPVFFEDDQGLEQALFEVHAAPGISTPGMVVLALLLIVAVPILLLRRRV